MGKTLPKIYKKGLLVKKQVPFMNLLVDEIVHEKPINIKLESFFNDSYV